METLASPYQNNCFLFADRLLHPQGEQSRGVQQDVSAQPGHGVRPDAAAARPAGGLGRPAGPAGRRHCGRDGTGGHPLLLPAAAQQRRADPGRPGGGRELTDAGLRGGEGGREGTRGCEGWDGSGECRGDGN